MHDAALHGRVPPLPSYFDVLQRAPMSCHFEGDCAGASM